MLYATRIQGLAFIGSPSRNHLFTNARLMNLFLGPAHRCEKCSKDEGSRVSYILLRRDLTCQLKSLNSSIYVRWYGHAYHAPFPGRFPQTMSPAKLIFPGSTAGTVARHRIRRFFLQEDSLSWFASSGWPQHRFLRRGLRISTVPAFRNPNTTRA